MENNYKIMGEATIRYYTDPFTGFQAYSTEPQYADTYLIYHEGLFEIEIQFEFKEAKMDTYLTLGLNHAFNNNPKITLQEFKPLMQLSTYYLMEIVFYENKNPGMEPPWARPRRFDAIIKFGGKIPDALMNSYEAKLLNK